MIYCNNCGDEFSFSERQRGGIEIENECSCTTTQLKDISDLHSEIEELKNTLNDKESLIASLEYEYDRLKEIVQTHKVIL